MPLLWSLIPFSFDCYKHFAPDGAKSRFLDEHLNRACAVTREKVECFAAVDFAGRGKLNETFAVGIRTS